MEFTEFNRARTERVTEYNDRRQPFEAVRALERAEEAREREEAWDEGRLRWSANPLNPNIGQWRAPTRRWDNDRIVSRGKVA